MYTFPGSRSLLSVPKATFNIDFFYFLATTFLFSIITITIYTKYGVDIQSNLLQSLPATSGLFVAQILVTAQLCFTSAISNTALFQDIEDFFKVPRGKITYQKLSRTLALNLGPIVTPDCTYPAGQAPI